MKAPQSATYKRGRILSCPSVKTGSSSISPGIHLLGRTKKDGLLYIPKNYTHDVAAAFAIMLHGSGGDAEHGLSLIQSYADDYNIILLCPVSRSYTWDIIVDNNFGDDVRAIDKAMMFVFEEFSINSLRVAIGGFSDGASYALCLGLTNGDIFTHVLALSPGFFYTVENNGSPKIFISHGVKDNVLPIDGCSRRIVPKLQKQNLSVNYQEFDGYHELPPYVSEKAVKCFFSLSL